jgi:2-polyprenyl-3-methyl-5-hydroxy-6-metoxy-1,4-benzoquinol methylase
VNACAACGGPISPWLRARGSEPADRAVYDLWRCGRCGSAVTVGPAPRRDAYESGAYAERSPRLARLAGGVLARFDRDRLALLGPPRGRLLDAGAGRGRFVAAARAAGWAADGIEPSLRGVEAARATYGVELCQVGIEHASGSYDVVSLWHVLEHLEDPREALDHVASLLSSGGLLLVGVPNLASAQARIGGERWFHLDLPRHRTHFTAAGLRALLERRGFSVEREQQALLEHNPFGLWQTIANRFTRNQSWLFNALKRNAPLLHSDALVTLALLPLAPLALVAEALFGRARRGGTIAVVARRR